jgi:hypothetical protein
MVLPLPVFSMCPAFMGIDGVIDNPSRMERKPGINPLSVIFGRVIIPIIIMAVPGSQKQGVIKDAQIDHEAGRKPKAQPKMHPGQEKDRREQNSPVEDGIIPVPAHKEIPTRAQI